MSDVKTLLITGAGGDLGTRMRRLLKDAYRLRLTDFKRPANLAPDEEYVQADLGAQAGVNLRGELVGCGCLHVGPAAPAALVLARRAVGQLDAQRVSPAVHIEAMAGHHLAERVSPQRMPRPMHRRDPVQVADLQRAGLIFVKT